MLKPGTRIGPYVVVAPLGAGGMGEVHRAHDTSLGRDVALKTLPEALTQRPERLAGLRREARILASLNHPGIATLHGIEESGGTPVLVMELVQGETLSERVRRGPLPLKDALRISQQVAEALAAAHEKAVLHRDLKPSNIRLTAEGRAKLLDFGLARALAEGTSADSHLSTETSPQSHPGAIQGTGPYMSPEQARGEEVDARTDVWAFGCVMYEMLTGKRAFPGATLSEAVAAVLEREPDWGALAESTPLVLQRLLRRCLRKEKEERLHDIADAGLELRELQQELSSGAAMDKLATWRTPSAPPLGPSRPAWLATAAVVLVVSGAAVLVVRSRRAAAPADLRQPRLEATLPRGVQLPRIGDVQAPFALSPDGHRVAFVGVGAASCQLYLRDRREIDARPLPGTEGASSPFFSPDGRWIGFAADGKLKKIALDGGVVETLADAPQFRGGSWGEDGTILFNRGKGGLLRVPAEGGEAREVTKPDPARRLSTHRWPRHLPGGRAALFDIPHEDSTHDVGVVDLETGRTRLLVEKAAFPRWAPTGHLLFARRGIVYAAPLDTRRLELTGPPAPVVEGVAMADSPGGTGSGGGNAYYDVAPDGTLVFSPREARLPRRTLVWVDREGRLTPLSQEQRAYLWPHLSPDGRRLAVTVTNDVDSHDVFILDIRRDVWTKLIIEGDGAGHPTSLAAESWMPDGRRLLVSATIEGQNRALLVPADGRDPPETLPVGSVDLADPAPDGRAVLFRLQAAPGQWDIWRLPLDGSRQAEPWLATPSFEVEPSFSPDGRWVAYRSNESGPFQIYVRPYPGPGPRHIVSTQGGYMPIWSPNRREIFFTDGRAFLSAAVRISPSFASDPPRRLFDLPDDIPWGFDFYDVTPDGQRFVMVRRDPLEVRPLGIVFVANWTKELAARMAAR